MDKSGLCLPWKNGLDYSAANLFPKAVGKLWVCAGSCPPLLLHVLLPRSSGPVWCQGGHCWVTTICTTSLICSLEWDLSKAVKIQTTFSRIYPGNNGRGMLSEGCQKFLPPRQACVSIPCLSPSPSIFFLCYHINNIEQAPHPRIPVPHLHVPSQLACLPPYALNVSVLNCEVHACDISV